MGKTSFFAWLMSALLICVFCGLGCAYGKRLVYEGPNQSDTSQDDDQDNDGYETDCSEKGCTFEAADCDLDPTINPGVIELCDGIDNDCDGKIDNVKGVGEICGILVGTCSPGTLGCAGGQLTCLGAIGPQTEICNGQDDDCDGIVDNVVEDDRKVGESCEPNPPKQGPCAVGVWACVLDNQPLSCLTITPTKEVCDGIDNDCDGIVDDFLDDFGHLTGVGCFDEERTGPCQEGVWKCNPADPTSHVCDQKIFPVVEECDGVDNDCDGKIDNHTFAGLPCAPGGCHNNPKLFVCDDNGVLSCEDKQQCCDQQGNCSLVECGTCP